MGNFYHTHNDFLIKPVKKHCMWFNPVL